MKLLNAYFISQNEIKTQRNWPVHPVDFRIAMKQAELLQNLEFF